MSIGHWIDRPLQEISLYGSTKERQITDHIGTECTRRKGEIRRQRLSPRAGAIKISDRAGDPLVKVVDERVKMTTVAVFRSIRKNKRKEIGVGSGYIFGKGWVRAADKYPISESI